jgi:PAS domain S-box-containing protein
MRDSLGSNLPRWSEKMVFEGNELFRKIFEEGPLGMNIITFDRQIVRANSTFGNMLGYSRDEIGSMRIEDITHSEDIDDDINLHKELCAGLIPYYKREKRYVSKSGKLVWASVTVSLIRDKEGAVAYAMEMVENIALRKQIEEILRTSEERYRTLVKNFPNGTVILFDRELKLVVVDGASIEKVGFSEGLLEGKTLRQVFSAKICSIVEPRCRAALRGLTDVFEISYANHVYQVHILPVKEGGRPVVWGMIMAQDITGQKRVEKSLNNSQKQLRSLALRLQRVREEERTYIAREIHDELGQALTGLKMDLAWLLKRLPHDQPLLNEKVRSMMQLSDSTIHSVSKISSELRPGVLDDLGLIAAIQWQAQDFQKRTGIACRFISTMEEIALDKDCATAVFRIFQETLANIIRHSGATIVTINLRKVRRKLVLSVTDNGRGIMDTEIRNPRSLGLLGMKERVMLFKGELNIVGKEGKGTHIEVRIPLEEKRE